VKTGHHRPAARALDDDRLDVHCYIDCADADAEQQQSGRKHGCSVGMGQERQHRANQDRCRGDDCPATHASGYDAGQRHADDRASAEAKQQ
jgi:hypothetical protein